MSEDLYLAVLFQRIRQARQQTTLTQEDVAEQLNLTLREYQRLEASSGKRHVRPNIIQLRQLSGILNVDLCLLVQEPSHLELEHLVSNKRKPGRPPKKTVV